ncbi:MAG: AZOBR_p60025 family cell surface glycopolymer formation protein [Anaerolineae bacterium]
MTLPQTRSPTLPRPVRPWTLTLLLAALYLGFVIWRSGGPLGLVLPGTQFTKGDPQGTEGYDGQFVYYIARDPLNAAPLIDVPPYRYQRILYPLLARLAGLGNPRLIVWALPLLNLLALAAGTWLVERMLAAQGANRWYALTVGLYAGQLLSARVDLPEPLALTLSLAGMLALTRRRTTAAALLFALAALTKETSLLFVAGGAAYLWLTRSPGQAIKFTALAAAPFALYQLLLWRWFGSPGIGSGGANATPFEVIPLAGFFRIAGAGWGVFGLFSLIMLPLVIAPAGWSLWVTLRNIIRRGDRRPWTFALLANAAIVPFIPFSTFREPLAMLRFTAPLVACVVLYGAARHSQRTLRYSAFWLAGVIFLLKDPFI